MKQIKVFISSAYTADNENDVLQNVLNQKMIAEELYSYGFLPFTPLLNHYHNQDFPHDYEFWLDVDKQWLSVCDCVLRDNSPSSGADREVEYAHSKNIPVFKTMNALMLYYDKVNDDDFDDADYGLLSQAVEGSHFDEVEEKLYNE